jgi:hypothetical protein
LVIGDGTTEGGHIISANLQSLNISQITESGHSVTQLYDENTTGTIRLANLTNANSVTVGPDGTVVVGNLTLDDIKFQGTWIRNTGTGDIYISPQDGVSGVYFPSDEQVDSGSNVVLFNTSSTGIVQVVAANKTWSFNSDGSLDVPGNIDGPEGYTANMTGFRAGWYGGTSGYAFKDDTDTGMFGWGSGDLRFKIDGNNAALVDADGWEFSNSISVATSATFGPIDGDGRLIISRVGTNQQTISTTDSMVDYINIEDFRWINLNPNDGGGTAAVIINEGNPDKSRLRVNEITPAGTYTNVNFTSRITFNTATNYIETYEGDDIWGMNLYAARGIGLSAGAGPVSITGSGLEVDTITNNDAGFITMADPTTFSQTATIQSATIGLNNDARAFGNGYLPVNANNMKIENTSNGASFIFAMKTGAGAERNVGISRTGNLVLANGVLGNGFPDGVGLSSTDGGSVSVTGTYDIGEGLSYSAGLLASPTTGLSLSTSVYDYDTDTGATYEVILGLDGTTTLPGLLTLAVFTATGLTAISGAVGQVAIVSDSAGSGHPNGMMAFWDTTSARWSYVHDNSAV